jgi:hypothetical protein
MSRRAVALALALPLALACASSEPADQTAPAEKAAEKKPRASVKKFEAPVPYGKQIACADLLDPARMGEAIGDAIGEVKDRSSSNREATAACAFMRAGTAPTNNAQLKAFNKNSMRLGVLPGDEYCTVTAFCAYPAEPQGFKKKCKDEGHREDESIGQFACVKEFQRANEYAYTYRTIDADTQCILEVMGGPSVTDEALVQNCTRSALEQIGPEQIKKFK